MPAPFTNYDHQIEYIIKHFDFKRVRKFLLFMSKDSESESHQAPTMQQLREQAEHNLRRACQPDIIYTQGQGWIASRDWTTNNLRLAYEVDSIDMADGA